MTKELEAPKNKTLTLINFIIESLILGLGTNVIVANAILIMPILGLPIIKNVFTYIVEALGSALNSSLKKNLNVIIIRMQNDEIKKQYDTIIDRLRQEEDKPTMSKEEYERELEKAKSAIDDLVNRNR